MQVRTFWPVVAFCALLTGASMVSAQIPSGPAFEVASVKPNKSNGTGAQFDIQTTGRFSATNVSLTELIRIAYNVRDLQVFGGPSWIKSDRFDIIAKADTPLQPGAPPPQLRQLLIERFSLQIHSETRELPIYALVLAKGEGVLGPSLRRSAVDYCAEAAAREQHGERPIPTPPDEHLRCGLRRGPGMLTAGSMAIASLAATLIDVLDRFVTDRTSLTGVFDFDLTFTPDYIRQGPQPPNGEPALVNGIPIDPNGPSIFTAVQEQLGLKLEATRGPVEVLVIDHVEHPAED